MASNKQAFSIAESPAAFKVLSSNLYSKPELAVIRELTSNAYDAQMAAGTNEEHPIELHIPTKDEAFFYVRDWGNGLSEDEIFIIYTQFFSSTKSEDNGQIGTFGLGSKSPFALTDEYTVKSYQDGIVKTYLMKIENDLPTVTLQSTEDTVEHNGLEVVIENWRSPIHEYSWTSAAEELFGATTFLPKMNFEITPYFAQRRALKTKSSVRIACDKDSRGMTSTAISVNVAGIGFDLGYSEKAQNLPKSLIDALGSLRVNFVNVMMNKLDIDLTPSRESLHFSEKTKANLTKAIKDTINNYFADADTNLKKMGQLVSMYEPEEVKVEFPDLVAKAAFYEEIITKSINAIHYERPSIYHGQIMMMTRAPGKKIPYNMNLVSPSQMFQELSAAKDRVAFFSLDMSNATSALKKSYEKITTEPQVVTSATGLLRGNLINVLYSHFENFLERNKKDPQLIAFYFLEKDTSALSHYVNFDEKVKVANFKSYYDNFKDDKKHAAAKAKKETAFEGPFFVATTNYFCNGRPVLANSLVTHKDEYEKKTLYCVAKSNYSGSNSSDCTEMATLSGFLGENILVAFRRGNPDWIKKMVDKNLCEDLPTFYKNIRSYLPEKYKQLRARYQINNLYSSTVLKEYFSLVEKGKTPLFNLTLKNTVSYDICKKHSSLPKYEDLGFEKYTNHSSIIEKILDGDKAKVASAKKQEKLAKENEIFALLDNIYEFALKSSSTKKSLQIFFDAACAELEKISA